MAVKLSFIFLAALLGAPGLGVAASELTLHHPEEVARLPPICKARLGPGGTPEWKEWARRTGSNFQDIHHYCFGVNYVNRSWRAGTTTERMYDLQLAVGDFTYVVKAEKPDFNPEIRAEVYSGRGEAYQLMGKPGEALSDFNRALAINPKMLRAYLQLADLQVSGKATTSALDTITQGLRHIPDSKTLQRRYLELGGKKPFPKPYVMKADEPESPQQVEPPSTAAQGVPDVPATSSDNQNKPTPAIAPSIGTPSNPYCRFCPPE